MVDAEGITISGGGSISVGTDAMFAACESLRELGGELTECLREIASIDRLVTTGRLVAIDAPLSARSAEHAMDDAAHLITRARITSALLLTALDQSARGYGSAEATARRLAESAAATAGFALGWLMPGLVLVAAPMLLGLATIAGVSVAALGTMTAGQRRQFARNLPDWLQKNSAVLSDPTFVTFVRLTAMSVDDATVGMLHLPPAIQNALGVTGLLGVASTAGAVVAIGRPLGYLRETPVKTVESSRMSGGSIPSGWEDRASRVPEGASQVRIDRYTVPGEADRFEVFVSGTRDFSLGPDSQPWDMTSNLHGIADGSPGSVRAVEQAMEQAGISPTSPVLFTGHSQGGLVIAQIAESGKYNTQGLYTLGAPAAHTAVPTSIPWIAVEHTNDIVPALSGNWTNSDPVLIQRQLYSASPVPVNNFFPSHQLGAYETTASMLDNTVESRLRAVEQRFERFTENATPADSTTWKSTRIRRE